MQVMSTVKKLRDKIRMTVDPTNHPLWTGQEVEVCVYVTMCLCVNN